MGGKRLDAERDARHAEAAEELGLGGIEGGGIRLEGDFIEFGEIDFFL